MRYHFTLVSIAIIKKLKNAGEGMEKREHLYTVGEMYIDIAIKENSMEIVRAIAIAMRPKKLHLGI
jgi:hypothetical protein